MMDVRITCLAFVIGLSASASLGQVEYVIDPAHSSIEFNVRHLGVSNVKGRFTKYSGSIWYNPSDVTQSSASVVIDAASIDTAEPKRDEHLRSADFFDVAKYPEIRFRTTNVSQQGDKYAVKGYLVMHGVSKEIEIEATLLGVAKDPWGNERIGVEGRTILNRQDFGISYSKVLDNGALLVGNDVKIELNIEAVRKQPTNTPAPAVKEAKPAEATPAAEKQKKDE
ncbi:MAG: YceI family protein [Candidatus Sumerlaeaceae bacterium]|jgi:polyisoprenoid-binding protein YceI